jgi:hypothetical protein
MGSIKLFSHLPVAYVISKIAMYKKWQHAMYRYWQGAMYRFNIL